MQLCSLVALRCTAVVNNNKGAAAKICVAPARHDFHGEKKEDTAAQSLIRVQRNLIERTVDTNFVLVTPQCNYGCPRVYIGGEYVKDA